MNKLKVLDRHNKELDKIKDKIDREQNELDSIKNNMAAVKQDIADLNKEKLELQALGTKEMAKIKGLKAIVTEKEIELKELVEIYEVKELNFKNTIQSELEALLVGSRDERILEFNNLKHSSVVAAAELTNEFWNVHDTLEENRNEYRAFETEIGYLLEGLNIEPSNATKTIVKYRIEDYVAANIAFKPLKPFMYNGFIKTDKLINIDSL